MESKATPLLLAVIAALLAAHLLRFGSMHPAGEGHPVTPVQEVVRAKLIDLVAEDGQVVAQLYADKEGGGELRLRSADGSLRVKLGATADGSGLVLMNDESDSALWAIASRSGTSVTLVDGKEKRVLTP